MLEVEDSAVSISCPFCNPDPDRVFLVRPRLLGIWDAFPVTPGHALIIPTRHAPDLASATAEERQGLWDLVDPVMKAIAKQHGPVDGFNIGINGGEAAGQTVAHLHMHIIPRRHGDVADPRGGVRYVIPAKANYLAVRPRPSHPPPEALLDLLTDRPAPAPAEAQPLVFDVESTTTAGESSRRQAALPQEPPAREQVEFLTHLQRLLDAGSFSTTYKYALLLSLADLAVEQGRDDMSELELSTDAISEKLIEIYWDHSSPFVVPPGPPPAETGAPPPAPKTGRIRTEKIVGLLAPVYGQVDGKLPALRSDAAAWATLVKAVRTLVQSTPLWKLQTVGDARRDFLFPSVGRGSQITLRPGVAFCLRRFHGVLGSLVRGAWVDWVRNQGREIVGDAADIEEFLFGSRRERLSKVVPVLFELQKGRCFYTGKELARPEQGEPDHFIPFARYSRDFAHNLVLVSKRALADKSDHLAAEDHLSAWAERNETVGAALADACTSAGIASDLARTVAVARWAYAQAERCETPVWTQGTTLERSLSGRWREILGGGVTPA
jgi:diadenosine tetraphosphate (Ap4A) HIT family hydrolase